jgi:cytochrome c oxidase cbb3-type subunit 3
MMRRLGGVAMCCAGLLVLAACEPWGQPKLEPQADTEDFATLFRENCSGCHGAEGKGGPGRILNDGLYLAWAPKDQLREVIAHGRAGTAMPAWSRAEGGPLTDAQINALVDGMESHWAHPPANTGTALPAYAEGAAQGDAARGQKLFLRDCFACHAKGGIVGPVTDENYLALTTRQNLRTAMVVGRPDLGMPNYRALNLGKALSEQDLADLVEYLASLKKNGSLK